MRRVTVVRVGRRKPYTFRTVLWDLLWTVLTSGFWLIWVLFRELRLRS